MKKQKPSAAAEVMTKILTNNHYNYINLKRTYK